MGPKQLIDPVRPWRNNFGQAIAAETVFLLARSLRTLVVRVERQNATAMAIANAMQGHPKMARVFYPGLPGFSGHAMARQQMRGFGGMVTLDIKGSGADATRVVDRLKLFKIAPSLGGVESLAPPACDHDAPRTHARGARPARHHRYHDPPFHRT